VSERAGRIEAFGFEATIARVDVIERPPSWRITRALLSALIGLGAAPVVMFVPPHVPWALGSIVLGGWFARRFAMETRTLVSLEGVCPKCGAELRVSKPIPLRRPHELSCSTCLQGLLITAVGSG
jgi:hypothetical protein